MMTEQAPPVVAIAAFFVGGYEALRHVRARRSVVQGRLHGCRRILPAPWASIDEWIAGSGKLYYLGGQAGPSTLRTPKRKGAPALSGGDQFLRLQLCRLGALEDQQV